ncbi:unnamed protein product [Parnassius mnemosyne]|uniref:Reverse transcriptase domain-containing protein n=1 Tax=Parnassius mnemosyne TaxID=213953 RepID=A0AAV1LG33_9NEOP
MNCDTENNNCIINSVYIDNVKVEKYLKNLDINKDTGPDGIHPIFLRQCSKHLAAPLSLLFNISLRQGVMPLLWKQSIVVPIFKSGDKHNIANYRRISKLSVIPKLFEKIIYDSLFPVIKPQIVSSQHGFIPGRSTETNLCEFQDETLEAMERGYQVDAVYTDFSKAFDKISHNLMIAKLVNVVVILVVVYIFNYYSASQRRIKFLVFLILCLSKSKLAYIF